MCTKEEMREVILEEFNGEFVKQLPVLLAGIQSTLTSHDRIHTELLTTLEKNSQEIKTRLDVANGRTKTNERIIAMAQGGLIILSMILVPMLGWALYELVNMHGTVVDIIEKELSTYQFELVD